MSTGPATSTTVPETSAPVTPPPVTPPVVVPPVSVPEDPVTPDAPETATVRATGGSVSIAVAPGATSALAKRGITIKGSGDAAYVDGALILPVRSGTLSSTNPRGILRVTGTISFVDKDGFGIDLNEIEFDLTDRTLKATVNEVRGTYGSVKGLVAPTVDGSSWSSTGGQLRLGTVFAEVIAEAIGTKPLPNFELGAVTVAADLE